jgi:hypothetical protein
MCPFLQDFPIYYNIGSQRSLWWFPLCLLLSPHYFPYFANLGLFFHYFRHRFARGLSIFVFSKNKLLFCWYFVCFLISISLILALNLIFLSFYFFWVLITFVFLGVWDVALGHLFELFIPFKNMKSWLQTFLLRLPLICTIGIGGWCFHFY